VPFGWLILSLQALLCPAQCGEYGVAL